MRLRSICKCMALGVGVAVGIAPGHAHGQSYLVVRLPLLDPAEAVIIEREVDTSVPHSPRPDEPLDSVVRIRSDAPDMWLERLESTVQLPVDLFRPTFGGTLLVWRRVCDLPCEGQFSSRAEYLIRGTGLATADLVRFRRGHSDVRVVAARAAPRRLGFGLASAGALLVMGGLVPVAMIPSYDLAAVQASPASYYATGGILLAAGAAMLATGITFVVRHSTRVTITSGAPWQESPGFHSPAAYVDPQGVHF